MIDVVFAVVSSSFINVFKPEEHPKDLKLLKKIEYQISLFGHTCKSSWSLEKAGSCFEEG